MSELDGAIILVVDDDDDLRRLVTLGLQRRGYRTVEAADGEAALRMVEATEIDLVLLDGSLPKLDGMEVLATLRSMPRMTTLPIIMVTGRSGLDDRIGGLTAGANDYVTKPVSLDELVARIEANLRGHRVWVDLMTQRLNERSQLAALLATTQPSFVDVVRHVVDTVGALPLVASAAMLDVAITGRATLLAHSDGYRPILKGVGVGLRPVLTAELARLSRSGASILTSEAAEGLFGHDSGSLVAATVGGTTSSTQALVIEIDPVAPDQRSAVREMLGLAVEMAPMIENMLFSRHRDEAVSELAAAIMQIVGQHEYYPVFQPIFDIDSGDAVGYEALTRFNDGATPDQRFAEARLSAMGEILELATLRAALLAATRLPVDRYLSLNVSAPLLAHPELPALLDLAGDRPICVELTEHEQIDDYVQTLADFRALGRNLRLSVDDAGSGWASLRHVLALRPDFVKLDRSWVEDIHTDPARQALLLGISRFVSELGGHVIAEGVEKQLELAALRSAGIHLAQGYLLGRPACAADLVGQ